MPKESQVATPCNAIVFADAGSTTTDSARLKPDDWVPDVEFDTATMQYEGGGCSFFYAPSYAATFAYLEGSARTLPRHNKRCNFSFYDGHVDGLKNSKAGYNYPRTDVNAWWARDHDSLYNKTVD
jgi:prepilin-type processing-associated H-X9-DG protein